MARRERNQLHGVLVVDKPGGITSATMVGEVRRRLGTDAAGHTGTLDPLATGVLPICLGAATKLAQWLLADDKAYDAVIELGVETDTFDRDGQVTGGDPARAAAVLRAEVEAALAALTGAYEQVPPIYSAIQQGGRRLHELARAGETADLAPRPVRVDRLRLTSFAPPVLGVEVACSKGTYVRSLVRDLGVRLGCGARLAELRRTASGRFTIDEAVALAFLDRPTAEARLIAPAAALALPSVVVDRADERDVLDGRALDLARFAPPGLAPGARFQLLTPAGDVLALAQLHAERIELVRVLTYGASAPPVAGKIRPRTTSG
ncbi:MAG TPA: tRNA pseudouridine(55) synthase TruB [Kofleriaceae bacterium]|nr:tRNA pseudouridine(55) synthase TruB [Kofleriaceae bacterium]